MKHIKTISIATFTLLLGLGLGYLIFNNEGGGNTTAQQTTSSPAAPVAEKEYTCSMHPQVRTTDPNALCPLCEMELIPVGENASSDPLVLTMTEDAIALAGIQTSVVGQAGVKSKDILLSGKVQADERTAASLVAHVPGRIEKLHITFTGERVQAGERIAEIYSPDLITAQRELQEASKLAEFNPALLEATRQKLRYWKFSDAQIATFEHAARIQETFTLYAEASGVVTKRKVAVGDYLHKGEALFELANLNRLWVIFDAYEEDLAHIKVGNRVSFTTPALPNKTFKTKITYIDPLINPKTRTASLRAEVSNSKGLLKPEMFVQGELSAMPSAKPGTRLSVPKTAVMWTGKRSVVYTKEPDSETPSFRFTEVELGDAIGEYYVVNTGLKAGDEVVTNGAFTIDAAAQLNNQKSMMNRFVDVKSSGNSTPDFTEKTPKEFKQQLTKSLDAYMRIKDAFVKTDAESASKNAGEFLKTLEGIDMMLLKGKAHDYWMQKLKAMKVHGQKISQAKNVEKQRKQFEFLSIAMTDALYAFGTSGKNVYYEYCPMAFDNKGAGWWSYENVVRNPYFGDKMLKCGLVKDSIVFGQ